MPSSSQSAPALLKSVLTASQNAVLVYQGVRNMGGELTDLRLAMLNDAAERNLGRPAREAVGLTFNQLYPHLVGTGLDAHYRQVIETGQAEQFEFQYTRPGQVRPSWCDVSAVRMEENCVVVSYNDITQPKADAEAARQAHRLKQAYNESINGIVIFDAIRNEEGQIEDFRIAMINDAGLRMNGYKRGDVEGRTLWEIYPATGINGLFDRYAQVCETGQTFQGEHYYPEFDCWREIKIVPIPQGILVAYNDITPIKKSEEKARHQTQLLERILEGVPVGIAVLQAIRNNNDAANVITDFSISRVNSVLEQLLEREANTVINQPLTAVFENASSSGLLNCCIAAVTLKEAQEFELPISRHEHPYWYRISIAPKDDQVILAITDISDIKLTQLAHHHQAELLSSVLDGSQNAIVAFDAKRDSAGQIIDFRYILQNDINRTLIGLSNEQLLGHTMLELFPEARKNGHFDRYVAVVNTGQPLSMDIEFDYGNGQGWYNLTAVKRADGFVLTVHDKTAEILAEQQLLEQTNLLQLISDNTPAGLVLWKAVRDGSPQRNVIDFRYRMANRINTYLTGHSAESLIGRDFLALFPRFRGTDLEMALRATIETGRTQRIIFTYYTETPGGWFDAQFIRVGTEKVLMTFMDVTEAHKAQLAYKEQADLFQTIINALPAGLVLFDPIRQPTDKGQPAGPIVDFSYALVNETEARTVGRSINDLTGQRFKTLFPSNSGQELFEFMVEVAETGQPAEWLLPFFADGVEGWFKSSVIPYGNQVLFTFLDVSELKQQQQALEIANLELQRSNENLTQFASIASHDLQEPLRKIQAFGSMLAQNYADVLDTDGQAMISRMSVAAERMSGLIKDLLNYSRISTHRTPFALVSLTETLSLVCENLAIAIEEAGALIEWGDLPVVLGDGSQLCQLFQNLLSNAIKFRRQGEKPRIQISCRQITHSELPVSVVDTAFAVSTTETGNSREFHEINIADNGIGFDEKYLDRIFQIFQRLHGKNQFVGTGVGLAVCRKVAENHRGALTATSQPGAGSTFKLYLPIPETR